MRIKRLAVAAAIGIVLVLLATAAFAYWFLAGDGVRLALEQQATAWLGQPVRIGGATARVFPRIAVKLQDIRIGEPARVTLTDAEISTDLRALLGRRIEDAEIVIADSRVNLPLSFDLPAARVPAPGTDGADESASGYAVRFVSVRTIALRDVRVISRGHEIMVSADSALEGTRLTVPRFTATSGRTQLDAEGVVELAPRIDARLRVKANRLDLDEMLALAEAFSPARETTSAGAGQELQARIAARVSAERATAAGVDVSQFATDFEIDGSDVTLAPLSFQLFGGRYQGSLNARLGKALSATIRSRVMDVDVSQLAAFGGVPGAMTGRLTAAGTFSGEGADMSAVLAAARGSGTTQIVDGSLQRLNLVRTVVLFFGRPAPDAAAASDRFDRIDISYSLARQTFRADAFSLHSPDADIVGSGTLRIDTKALDGHVDLSLSEGLSAQAGSDLYRYTREGTRVVLPARIGGTLDQPRLAIDATAAVKRGLKNEVERRLKGFMDRFSAKP